MHSASIGAGAEAAREQINPPPLARRDRRFGMVSALLS